jgi:ABC-type glycerol-3-phosphate transport system substrate-binding protein
VKIEIARGGSYNSFPTAEKDIILKELNQRLDLNIDLVSSLEYGTYINTRIASGSYPDLFGVGKDLRRNPGL